MLSFEVLSGFYESCAAAAQSWPRVGEGEDKVRERGEPLPVLWDRIEERMSNDNGVDFVGLYAGVSNVFGKKERGEMKYILILHQSLDGSVHILVEEPISSPSIATFP